MIFNRVVSSSLQKLCNIGPLVSKFLMRLEYNFIFLDTPWLFVDLWVKMIMPPELLLQIPLSTLFPRSLAQPIFITHSLADQGPLLAAMFLDQWSNCLVLLHFDFMTTYSVHGFLMSCMLIYNYTNNIKNRLANFIQILNQKSVFNWISMLLQQSISILALVFLIIQADSLALRGH